VNELYTSHEAREVLKVSTSTFKNFVDSGRIRKITPPGKKQGLYLREDVDRLAEERKPFSGVENARKQRRSLQQAQIDKNEAEIDWMDEKDLPYILAYDYEMYGVDATVDIPKMHSWWLKNPKMARMIFDKKDRRNIWGSISILPMKEETILKILKDEMSEHDITADDILTYESDGKYYGYISAASIKPEHRTYLRRLIENLLSYWCNQYPNIQLIKLYAVAWSDGGWDLVKHLFFSPRHDLGEDVFEIDLKQRNPSRLIKAYQDCIKHKEEQSSFRE
jgi:hypothetical protein